MHAPHSTSREQAESTVRPWERYSPGRRYALLFVLFLVGTSSYADRAIISVLVEPLKAEFGMSDTVMGMFGGLTFALFYATLALPVARWADRGNRKLIIAASLAIWSLMTALCGVAQTFWQLALARVGVGAGEAGALPASQSLVADYFPPSQRNRAFAILLMSSMAGGIVGLAGGGYVVEYYGWRAAFLVAGLPGLLLAILTYAVLDEPRRDSLAAAAPSESFLAALRMLVRKPSFVLLLCGISTYFVIAGGEAVFFISFIIRRYGLSVSDAGGMYSVVATISALVGTLFGTTIVNRMVAKDERWSCWLPAAAMLAAWPIYELVMIVQSLHLVLVLQAMAGTILIGAAPPMFNAIHIVCGSKRRATAVALMFFFINLIGQGLGPVLVGALSDWLAVGESSPDSIAGALMIVYVLFAPGAFFLLRASRSLLADRES